MALRKGYGVWEGRLRDGKGTVRLGSGAFEGPYSFESRFEEGTTGTNPEELLGAAHAACFSMALSVGLERAGFPATRVATAATVHLVKGEAGFSITQIDLVTDAVVPGIDAAAFQEQAEAAKAGCPISKALAAVKVTLNATLAPG
ncbi:MAG: OsmC family peroxiredoxin [Acidobacteriota bacterium]